MRIDCHTHTAAHSPCSTLPEDTLCSLARTRGLDALVITEHNAFRSKAEMDALRLRHLAPRLYMGVELSLPEAYDVVYIGDSALLPMGRRYDIDALAHALAPHRAECFLFVAHPFRFNQRMTTTLRRILEVVDGIECNSVNILRSGVERADGVYRPRDHGIYAAAQRDFGLVPVYNSDAHYPCAVGAVSALVEADAPPEDETALARLLKKARIAPHQDATLLDQCAQRGLFSLP